MIEGGPWSLVPDCVNPTNAHPARFRAMTDARAIPAAACLCLALVAAFTSGATRAETMTRQQIEQRLAAGPADLSNLEAPGADLKGLDFAGASLFGANLKGADLSNAKLAGCNLNVAILRDA